MHSNAQVNAIVTIILLQEYKRTIHISMCNWTAITVHWSRAARDDDDDITKIDHNTCITNMSVMWNFKGMFTLSSGGNDSRRWYTDELLGVTNMTTSETVMKFNVQSAYKIHYTLTNPANNLDRTSSLACDKHEKATNQEEKKSDSSDQARKAKVPLQLTKLLRTNVILCMHSNN